MPRHADYVGPFPKDMPDHAVLDVSAAESALEVPCCSNTSRRLGRHLVAALDEVNRLREEATAASGTGHQKAARLAERLEAFAQFLRDTVKPPPRGVFLRRAKIGYTVCVDGFDLGLETSWSDADALCQAIATRRPPGDARGYGRDFHSGTPFGVSSRSNPDHTVTLGISVREPTKDQ